MKKFFVFFPIIIFLLGLGGLFLDGKILAQFPSFEVYSGVGCGYNCECGSEPENGCSCPVGINCTSYPTVEDVQVEASMEDDWVIVTAKVFDVSGVSSVVAKIEDPNSPGTYMASGTMSCMDCDNFGNGTYQKYFSISSADLVEGQTYYAEIFTVDRIFNSSNVCSNNSAACSGGACPCYWRVKSFGFSSISENIVELWEDHPKESWGYGNSDKGDPYNTWYKDSRAQFIILADDLSFAGLKSGSKIIAFYLEASQSPGRNLKDFRVRVKLTTSTVSTSWEGGWTNFFGPEDIPVEDIVVGEWKEYDYDYDEEQGFVWDGQSNIMVDISRDDISYTSGGGMYKRTGFIEGRMFSGYCDDCEYYNDEYVKLFDNLYEYLGIPENGFVRNYVPAIKIKHLSY